MRMKSKQPMSRRTLLKGAVAGGSTMLLGTATKAFAQRASITTVRPYALPSTNGVAIQAILTAGEAAENGYRMVGIPDGLGALGNGQTFTLFMNHELTSTAGSSGPGIVRAHGSSGAFVSKWTIERRTLRVLAGEDMTPSPSLVQQWDPAGQKYFSGTTAWGRLCSADLPDERALRFL